MGPITDAHKIQYARNIELAIQQKSSRFTEGFTYHGDWRGKKMIFEELMGPANAILGGARGGDTPNIDSQIEPVGVLPIQIEWGKLIEKEDAIKALTDYQSPFVQVGGAAIVRGRDNIFATALFANRFIGEDGSVVQAWDPTNKLVAATVGSPVGAPADVGFNVKKVLRGKRLMQQLYVDIDTEDLWAVTNAQGLEELYSDITYINTDYRKMSVLDEKNQVRQIAGVNIVQYEGMPDIDGTHFTSAMWCKSGMHYGDFDPLTTTVERNPQKKYRWHPYLENWFGAARSEDGKVIKISNLK